jgi:hypothetical protein
VPAMTSTLAGATAVKERMSVPHLTTHTNGHRFMFLTTRDMDIRCLERRASIRRIASRSLVDME